MLTERLTATGRATEILRDLVSIESVNPQYPGGERGEVEMTAYLDAFFSRLGLEARRQEVLPGRENIWTELSVPGATRTLLLESHMDTVTLEPVGRAMLDPRVEDGRMRGRGSCDTKASLAAMLAALEALTGRREELRANVVVLGSVDEEFLMRGIVAFAGRGQTIDAAVVGEPTQLNVVRAHKGLVRWNVRTRGRAAHTSRPETGDNAVYQMVEVIGALRGLEPVLATRSHLLLGSPTLTVSMINGGLGPNIVPDACEIAVDRRTLPSERHDDVIAEVATALESLQRRSPGVKVDLGEPFANILGLDTADDVPFVRLATRVAREHGGADRAIGVPYGTNASALAPLGIPTIVLGPGDIAQAHSIDEWVDLSQVERCAALYTRLALEFGADGA